MAPIAFLILLFFLVICWVMFRKQVKAAGNIAIDIEALDTTALVTDRRLLRKGLVVIMLVIVGFLIHGALNLEPATIALAGATILLLWGRSNVDTTLRSVEWVTLFFFIGLFITIEGLIKVGIIESIGQWLISLTRGDLTLTSMLILWMSSVASGIVDNIPYTATMIPIVETLGTSMPIEPLWWSLALGACLGGNATLVGASANIVVANLAERSGYPISFYTFLRYGIVTTFFSLILASVYVWLRYL
jgi:Na+/H+ antiporter NhaD/arsenite permease-like protein